MSDKPPISSLTPLTFMIYAGLLSSVYAPLFVLALLRWGRG
jgi:hypothetical protein